jgi:hypothetical protein
MTEPHMTEPHMTEPHMTEPHMTKPHMTDHIHFYETGNTLSTIEDLQYTQQTPHSLLVNLIQLQKKKEDSLDIWKNSPYKDFVKLQSNNAGNVGESFIQFICTQIGLPAYIDGTKTKKIGGGVGDGTIKDKSVEIKTAHQGSTYYSFQHELGEMPWNAEYMIFIDISPTCLYLTIFKNFSENFYKSGEKCKPYFPKKSVTWRKGKGAFKLDTTVSINELNIEKGYTFKITENTSFDKMKDFIDSLIK